MTPEGRVKAAVKRVLDKYKGFYTFWPVPSGYGPSSLDCLLCVCSRFVAIETKAPGKKPTPRQKLTIERIERAGGVVFIIDGTDKTDTVEDLDNYLKNMSRLWKQATIMARKYEQG